MKKEKNKQKLKMLSAMKIDYPSKSILTRARPFILMTRTHRIINLDLTSNIFKVGA